MTDPDVTSNKGVYTYVLTGEERHLSIRAFDDRMRRTAYEQPKGICPGCNEHFEIEHMQADHKTAWSNVPEGWRIIALRVECESVATG